MSTARPSRKRQAAPADTDSPRRTSKTAPADADSRAAPPDSGGAQSTTRSPWCCRAAAPWGLPAGVYQGLHEAGIRPNWVAGISIGSINAAIIAGSPEDERVRGCAGSGRRSAGRPASPPCLGAIRWPACSRAFRSASARRP